METTTTPSGTSRREERPMASTHTLTTAPLQATEVGALDGHKGDLLLWVRRDHKPFGPRGSQDGLRPHRVGAEGGEVMAVGEWILVVFAVAWLILIVGGYFYLRPFRL